jgi:LPS O-antigen subunit length determinant protein (WzzB/FepE family)
MGNAIGNLAGISFDINESPKNRKMRAIRKLSETGAGGEKEAAIEKMKQMGGPQLPLAMNNPMLQMGNMGAMIGGMIGRGVVN